ncbi:hypothetical protein TIFTF001_041688 [Ficus carica]|uniref:Uncharacterized protein n=1 Tax=Ficus carica TaxID=3494 RepID=A0AA87Z8F9_FICCA|nr:hypothetical protein TIFTF001_041688 [Ficus carica]
MHWCEGARLVFWSASQLTRVDGALRALSLWNALVRGGSSGILKGHSGPLASGMHWYEGARLVFWSAIRLTLVDGALRQDGEARAPPAVSELSRSALLGSDIRKTSIYSLAPTVGPLAILHQKLMQQTWQHNVNTKMNFPREAQSTTRKLQPLKRSLKSPI